jgi:hypothetical protein
VFPQSIPCCLAAGDAEQWEIDVKLADGLADELANEVMVDGNGDRSTVMASGFILGFRTASPGRGGSKIERARLAHRLDFMA